MPTSASRAAGTVAPNAVGAVKPLATPSPAIGALPVTSKRISDALDKIDTTCKWAKNQNFLVRTFSISIGNKLSISGVQIIGWDPAAKQIRSWVFDSNGGFGEGMWTKKGKSWHIQSREPVVDL